ncbi:MAG TPA: hypothetical protein VG248_14740 [Caulobacteraceae bacterium]|nr:hypothetical protein [Caulobacteraceae bacterium]
MASMGALALILLAAPAATLMWSGGSVAQAQAVASADGQAAAGAEYTEYYPPFRPRNQFLVGGLLAWTGVLAGGLAVMEGRRLIGLGLGGSVFVLGLLLMFGLTG